MQEKILEAEFFRRNGRIEEAMRLANEVLNENCEEPHALFLIANCHNP